MKRTLLALIVVLACAQSSGSSFDQAASAAASAKFREAAKLYADAAQTDADPVRRAKAAVRLANIEWRVLRQYDDARTRLRRVAAGEHESFPARLELVRVSLERKDFAAARADAAEALGHAKNKRDVARAKLAAARVVLDDPKHSHDELRAAVGTLKQLIAERGPTLEATRMLARAALIVGDGASALEGINGYYHVSEFAPPPNAIAAAHAELARILPAWRGTGAERAAIVSALAGIRFFKEASLVAREPSDVTRYAAALERMDTLINEYYRQMALGEEDDDDLRDGVKREMKPFEKLKPRFGTYVNIGKTGGFIDAHIGHIVGDRTLAVEQYGRKAAMRFIELDAMVSNGFGVFLSDGQGGDGGWATDKEIYQVRPAYANGALRDWQRLFDEDVRAEADRDLAAETARDIERAKTHPIGEFRGLAMRLKKQYLESLASLPREEFMARVEREEFQYSILLHEGRHAIDKLSKEKFKVWELEYRAKLSEIALADAPRAALQSVVDNTIGGDSPHGKANEELAKGIVAWMEKHRAEIAGLDPSQPLFPQVDKLTDAQIKSAVRSLDPLAR
jgi:hypothetical protein